MHNVLVTVGLYIENRVAPMRPRSPALEPTTQTAFSASTPTFTNLRSK